MNGVVVENQVQLRTVFDQIWFVLSCVNKGARA